MNHHSVAASVNHKIDTVGAMRPVVDGYPVIFNHQLLTQSRPIKRFDIVCVSKRENFLKPFRVDIIVFPATAALAINDLVVSTTVKLRSLWAVVTFQRLNKTCSV